MQETRGLIWNIQRYCIHDGDGIRTTVFMMGCPLRCMWCSNPEGLVGAIRLKYNADICIGCGKCIEVCPVGANTSKNSRAALDRAKCIVCGKCVNACPVGARSLTGKVVTVAQVMDEVRRDLPFYRRTDGGLTCSGGEALLQVDFLEKLLKAAKNENINTAVETSGAVPWDNFQRILDFTDMFYFDLKCIDSNIHKKITGGDNKQIIANAVKLCAQNKKVVFRLPVIPGLNDYDTNILETARFIKEIKGQKLELLPYHNFGVKKYKLYGTKYLLVGLNPPEKEHLEHLKELASKEFRNVIVRYM